MRRRLLLVLLLAAAAAPRAAAQRRAVVDALPDASSRPIEAPAPAAPAVAPLAPVVKADWLQQQGPAPVVAPTAPQQPSVLAETPALEFGGAETAGDAARFESSRFSNSRSVSVGTDLYSPPAFEGGLIIFGKDVAMKLGGYVKTDFIYDFDPIDNMDAFDTTTIPVGAPHRTNSRAHARQTRLSFDTRWESNGKTVRFFVESDFFSEGDHFRLRHAYAEVGSLLVGQTWTTFTDVQAAPRTLDFEGSVAGVNRRQPMARWTWRDFLQHEGLILALALEDTQFIIIPPPGVEGSARTPSPDFVGHLRYERELLSMQLASLYRVAGFQPEDSKVFTGPAWGLNLSTVVLLTGRTDAYGQVLYGEGIGSYRGLPDAVPVSETKDVPLPMLGWMVGITREWSDRLNSNFTYAENEIKPTALQDPDSVGRVTYLAANLIWFPLDRVGAGVEYLYGLRENVSGEIGAATRLQVSCFFELP